MKSIFLWIARDVRNDPWWYLLLALTLVVIFFACSTGGSSGQNEKALLEVSLRQGGVDSLKPDVFPGKGGGFF